MRFGVREICNVVFRAKAKQNLGNRTFLKNEPVLYFETLKTSSLEGAATTVYATGGRGNAQLVAWEGERTLTFNMEDALISPESFSILSGAGLMDASTAEPIYVHTTSQVEAIADGWVEVPNVVCWNGGRGVGKVDMTNEDNYHAEADIYCMKLNDMHEIDVEPTVPAAIRVEDGKTQINVCDKVVKGDIVLVDYYVKRTGNAMQIDITPDQFGGYYYVEASTLFRREADGKDLPAEFVIPRAKVRSNFTFSMAATGDPSTFSFVLDAFPDYTKFNGTKKVLAAMQVITDADDEAEEDRPNCTPGGQPLFKQSFASPAAGVKVEETSGTAIKSNVKVSGTDVAVDYDMDTFGDLDEAKVVEIQMNLPMTPGEQYTIVQTNPALELYDGKDNRVSKVGDKWVKTQTITAPAADEMFQMLMMEAPATAEVKVYHGAGTTNLVKTYSITSALTIA